MYCYWIIYLVLLCFCIPAGPLPEQNVLGEEAGRGSKESHPFSSCSSVSGWTCACSQPACGDSRPRSACQHCRGVVKTWQISRYWLWWVGDCIPVACPATVSERRVGGKPRAVPEGSPVRRHHLPQPHEEQPHARAQHHQRQRSALTLPVHQQHAPAAAGHSQPVGREAAWVGALHVCSRFASVPFCVQTALGTVSSSVYYEGLQDKLAQVRDARAALNALRDEHREKLRRAAEEAERQRQIQLAQKLEIMRQKKQVIKSVFFSLTLIEILSQCS